MHSISINNVTFVRIFSVLISESTSMIFETLDLTKASPAIVSRCGVVHLSSEVVHWKFLIESWIGSAKACWDITNEW